MVRIHPDPPYSESGGLAQLGERLLCKQEVNGSIPLVSTRQVLAGSVCSGRGGGFQAEAWQGFGSSLKIWKE